MLLLKIVNKKITIVIPKLLFKKIPLKRLDDGRNFLLRPSSIYVLAPVSAIKLSSFHNKKKKKKSLT